MLSWQSISILVRFQFTAYTIATAAITATMLNTAFITGSSTKYHQQFPWKALTQLAIASLRPVSSRPPLPFQSTRYYQSNKLISCDKPALPYNKYMYTFSSPTDSFSSPESYMNACKAHRNCRKLQIWYPKSHIFKMLIAVVITD